MTKNKLLGDAGVRRRVMTWKSPTFPTAHPLEPQNHSVYVCPGEAQTGIIYKWEPGSQSTASAFWPHTSLADESLSAHPCLEWVVDNLPYSRSSYEDYVHI